MFQKIHLFFFIIEDSNIFSSRPEESKFLRDVDTRIWSNVDNVVGLYTHSHCCRPYIMSLLFRRWVRRTRTADRRTVERRTERRRLTQSE